jgi:hypothetical protein
VGFRLSQISKLVNGHIGKLQRRQFEGVGAAWSEHNQFDLTRGYRDLKSNMVKH